MSKLFWDKIENRGNGIILNLSSMIAECPMPFGVVYGAGKSFDKEFSLVLAQESKVNVICLQPGIVDTPMARKLKKQVLVINSEECAESSLKAVGISKKTFGHWKHWVAAAGFVIFKDVARRVARYM